ncbi:MAG: lipase chaperone [Thermodesulfobacteriota bacterium]
MKDTLNNLLAAVFTVIAVAAAAFTVLVAIQATALKGGAVSAAMPGYIFDKSYAVGLDEITRARELAEKFMTGENGQLRPGQEIDPASYMTPDFEISVATLAYFNYLGALFADNSGLPAHLEKVKALLFEKLPEDRAQRLYSLYENYISCELELSTALAGWKEPQSAADVVRLLTDAQKFRREYLGQDVADALFGTDIKTREYAVRRGAIAGDPSLYGKEKEKRVARLTEDMWGDQAQAISDYSLPFHRYREKLQMYAKDMAEMKTDEQRTEMVRGLRNLYFSPEIVAQMEEIDAQTARQKETDARFEQGKQEILGNDALSQEEKDARLRDLAKECYGEQLLPPESAP